ncbi:MULTISPECIES: leucine-rich repeat-containing protein kinase family protein [unclassified Pseudomonas]|uniref:leucine-rich repeat-containing protein kinase family protein n=1 Tax=unclassified Pseudomonas TaxID=196821 RepID=UPI002446C3EE|nr:MULTISPECIES: leucine-rich repeat-containing protein kinase family protein [unclassified Pseudomonas]MDH0892985.1 protein kinase [Pseudomonas sp. GD03875]MDH1067474.1 protein kinase [Pseudomonas sp. GD03985]
MHSLEQLRRGELAGITRLDLAADLDEFPREIFDLADSLEVLNLSGNRLTALPHDLARLHRLKVLFCSDNPFETLPEALGDCPQLEMVGFKANRIRQVPAAALPARLRWLILTDNRVEALPAELGERPRLQKLMLAGNRLRALPQSMAALHQLELLRIAANRIEALPDWLLRLPRLAWLAFAGNPGSDASEAEALARHPLPAIERDRIELGEVLGQGASGIIRRADWRRPGQPARAMAAKLFKGELTSDGLPHSEMAACLAAGEQDNLIRVAGPLAERPGEPAGLLLELIGPHYRNLAGPPSLASCTRDIYPEGRRFAADEALRIARGAAAAVAHLHRRGILHGDLYAHNLLVDATGHCLLGDFGAASFFAPHSAAGTALQRIEARAFGCLLEELLQRCDADVPESLWQLQRHCDAANPDERPDFAEILDRLAR